MSSLDYLDLCRLCLVKDRVSVPIFEDEGDVRQIFLKITACLPVKVGRDDKLPKKICDDCVYKVELFYQFWNTTANAEKQLLQWLGEVGGLEEKQGYVTDILNQNVMKQERNSENRLEGSLMQVSGHPNNMDINMMDENMTLSIPMMIPTGNQQISVPMDSVGNTVQAVPGPSTQASLDQVSQSQVAVSSRQDEEDETSDEDDNTDDDCDNEGLPVKEESEDDPNSSRNLEPATFVNVSLCDEAGPSGLQQQKISEMSEIAIPQTSDGDPKTEYSACEVSGLASLPLSSQLNCITGSTQDCLQYEITTNVKEEPIDIKIRLPKYSVQNDLPLKGELYNKSWMNLRGHLIDKTILSNSIKGKKFVVLQIANTKTSNPDIIPYSMLQHTSQCTELYNDGLQDVQNEIEVETKVELAISEPTFSVQRQNRVNNHIIKHTFKENYFYTVNANGTCTCDICNAVLSCKSSLYRHIRLKHTHAQPTQCSVCLENFESYLSLKEHRKIHRSIDMREIFYCDHCEYESRRKTNLALHIMSKHSNNYPYSCTVCSKQFKLKQTWQLHITKHATPKHVCEVCGRGYYKIGKLMTHMNLVHQRGYTFKCNICNRVLLTQRNLNKHMKLHEQPYLCNVCGMKFISAYKLKRHCKLHSGEKKFLCPVCSKAFAFNDTMRVHYLTHTGIKPYGCILCEKRFSQRSALMLHWKTKHPEEIDPPPPIPLKNILKDMPI